MAITTAFAVPCQSRLTGLGLIMPQGKGREVSYVLPTASKGLTDNRPT